ncbi:NAD(P)/FAD-dependent oxidoreductase [Azospirillum sp. SYSU D00513]|uniref:NAD(P)/FAD-dependent oxidoreductase n=1 Tax=Azospirillum sp. SYSU D00513 TaxID=2812561 RepID=UPI001A960DF2|nr:NAD(P)/FAD-dependent oxidoreductase [Azospirillum sp. SYSU D00513]
MVESGAESGSRQDVVIVGAGAAGLMCAMEAGKRGRRVLVIDHAAAPGEKIRISGGGRCNFTNLHTAPDRFLSRNPRFCLSALRRYTQHDFIALVQKHGIAYHEKKLGQLFCDGSSRQIVDMLLAECRDAGVRIQLGTSVTEVGKTESGFRLATSAGEIFCESLVVATGGPSIPKMGATGWGYELAARFGLKLVPTRPALVPFTLSGELLERAQSLAGVAVDARVELRKARFEEAILFTHRGLSGPAILQISSYWREGEEVRIDLLPGTDLFARLKEKKAASPRQELQTVLADVLPKRLAQALYETLGYTGRLADYSHDKLQRVGEAVNGWRVLPSGTEGYRTAEVTLGGVDTDELSSKTLEAKSVPGLYFIGEVVDVTGHLGGYNFQWAWSSGYAAGQHA